MRDSFGEEDFEGSEEAKELPNVIPKCHKKPTVSEMQAVLHTFLTDPEDLIRGL